MADDDPLSADSLFTAARRIVRFIRIDDQAHGGLLSQQTVAANELLSKHVDAEERRLKRAQEAEGK
jgi:hypothetical protein